MVSRLHWERTLASGWSNVSKHKSTSGDTSRYPLIFQYNATSDKLRMETYPAQWSTAVDSNHTTTNNSALMADKKFLAKSGIIGDMLGKARNSHSFTTVIVISSLFLFVTLALTIALVIFCRKRNTVFAFQKSEQEDYADYEMDEIDTDTETDIESDIGASKKCKRKRKHCSHSQSAKVSSDSTAHEPLMEAKSSLNTEITGYQQPCLARPCRCSHDDYQLVVTAVLERQGHGKVPTESSVLVRSHSAHQLSSSKNYGLSASEKIPSEEEPANSSTGPYCEGKTPMSVVQISENRFNVGVVQKPDVHNFLGSQREYTVHPEPLGLSFPNRARHSCLNHSADMRLAELELSSSVSVLDGTDGYVCDSDLMSSSCNLSQLTWSGSQLITPLSLPLAHHCSSLDSSSCSISRSTWSSPTDRSLSAPTQHLAGTQQTHRGAARVSASSDSDVPQAALLSFTNPNYNNSNSATDSAVSVGSISPYKMNLITSI